MVKKNLNQKGCSFTEIAILYYIKKIYPDAESREKKEIGMELDIYIPSIKTAIEYDGYYHKWNVCTDLQKNKLCERKGIVLYRVRVDSLPKLDDTSIDIYIEDNYDDMNKHNMLVNQMITDLCYKISGKNIAVDIKKDMREIFELAPKDEPSVEEEYPEILKDWDYDKNVENPSDYTSRSNKKVYWKCSKGHSYQRSIVNKVQCAKCPYCSRKLVLPGETDLLTLCPALKDIWATDVNKELFNMNAENISVNSKNNAFFICKKGHYYLEEIRTMARTPSKEHCPYCLDSSLEYVKNSFEY